MIQLQSKVNIADNSGVLEATVIKLLKPKNKKIGCLGSLLLISSKKQTKLSNILPGSKFKSLLIRSKKENKEIDKTIKFDNNSVVLVKAAPKDIEYVPIGSRIKGPVSSY